MPTVNSASRAAASAGADEITFATAAPHAPVTVERSYRLDTDNTIKKPYIARASAAVSVEQPYGSIAYERKYGDYSVLQQHVLFWDRDGDGEIWPQDTYIGFRDLGFNVFFSLLATFILNICFSIPTRLGHTLVPDPFFRIYVSTIHMDKHGSSTGVYDTEGRFIPSHFEDIFAKYASGTDVDTLTLRELFQMMHGQRCAWDLFGWTAELFEWGTVWMLTQQDGRVHKDDVRKIYDGSLFFDIREARRSKDGWKKGWGLGGDGFVGSEKTLPFSL